MVDQYNTQLYLIIANKYVPMFYVIYVYLLILPMLY